MSRPEFIEQLVQQASKLARDTDIPHEVESRLRVLMQGAFDRMDLVSRDEFDAQAAVLARTRKKLIQLENQLAELQTQLDQSS
ncbi:accessory factor UbiK family protein [Litorivivens sp.]|uniref:accessory factor UbiK family protein n=1 Tax=Litorivivens sp. TaxID=2020868 RepID=UPI003565D74D